MKKSAFIALPLSIAAALCANSAQAQSSSLTIYGLLDIGLTWTSNVAASNGGSMTTVDTGVAQGSRLGFRGAEDLGGGNKAIFTLESGMMLDTGTLAQGGLMFGRQSSVGLSSSTYGELSLGRMFDVMGEIFPAYAVASNTPAGLLAWSLDMNMANGAALPNRVYGSALNNSVRYRSPTFGGFSGMATYSLGEKTASSVVSGSSFSGALTYKAGAFSGSVGTFQTRDASTTNGDLAEYALGAAYQMDTVRLYGMFTQVGYTEGTKARVSTTQVGMNYNLTPTWILGTGFQTQSRKNLEGAQQVTVTLDYLLSKRTDVYAVVATAHDSQYAAIVEGGGQGYASAGSMQTGIRVGIRHKF